MMQARSPRPNPGQITLLLGLAAMALLVRLLSPGIPEAGDGVSHYQYARYAPQHPSLLLDLWAKPVFTLLAMPLAQLGAWGTALLNVLLYVATALPIMRIAEGRARGAAWAVPVLLILAPTYLEMVLAGMTEVLFGALAAWALWCLWEERYTAAALVASFLPFSRPEWVGFLPFVVLWMLWQGAWRKLPWLTVGAISIGSVGAVVRHDPLWLLHDHPYLRDIEYYGSGSFWHYVIELPRIFGMPLLVCAMVAFLLSLVLMFRARGRDVGLRFALLLTLLPALAILFIHSWIWWRGSNGSYGLVRVLATTVPLIVLFTLFVWANWMRDRKIRPASWAGAALLVGYGIWGVFDVTKRVVLPIQENVAEQLMDQGAHLIQALGPEDRRIAVAHPYAAFTLGRDPFDSTRTPMFWRLDWTRKDLGLKEGDLILWDSNLGPSDGGLPLERLLEDPGFKLLGGWIGQEPAHLFAGAAYTEVYVFERRKTVRTVRSDTLIDLARSDRTPPEVAKEFIACPDRPVSMRCLAQEFPMTIEEPLGHDGSAVIQELVVQGIVRFPAGVSRLVHLVFNEKNAEGRTIRYHQSDLGQGPFELHLRSPALHPGMRSSLYWWRQGGEPFELEEFRVVRLDTQQERTVQSGS